MDVGELLNFKPSAAPKRPANSAEAEEVGMEEFDDDPNESYEKRAAKRRKLKKAAQKKMEEQRMAMLEAEAAAAAAAAASADNGSEAGPSDEILARLEEADKVGDATVDEVKLKRMILNFDKKIGKNQELRIKFPEDPAKFMNSEVELHDTIQELRVIATVPDLYPILVDNDCISTLLGKP